GASPRRARRSPADHRPLLPGHRGAAGRHRVPVRGLAALPAGEAPLRNRRSASAGSHRDDVRPDHRRPRAQRRHLLPAAAARPHGIRPDHRDRPRYVRAAAPALGGYRVCLRERAGGGETREAHRRPAGARAARPGLYAVAVTLGRLLLAWVLVAAWFLIAGWAGRRLAERAGG